ncbi:unnamed protein product [Closterium sp. Naga37s-1]|nr:unnamed protein product [Closterium sp. Naga37s-1]
MARTLLICLMIVLLVAPSVFARKHPDGAGHHNRNGTRTGGHHKGGGHHKSGGGSSSGLTSSKGVTAGKTCKRSSLGYKAAVDLTGKGLLFHWTVSGSTLNAAIEAQSTSGASGGYFSVGFSSSGKMCPSDAVVGINGASAGKVYKLESYTKTSPSTVSTIVESSLKPTSGSLFVKFSRPGKGGGVNLNLKGKNNIIWAFGKNKKFEAHTPTNRGSKSVDLSCVALMFHWKVSGSTLSAAVEAPSNKGSVSVGFSKSGKMYPADVVTGYSGGSVASYKLTGYSGGSTSKIKGSSAKSSSGATTFKFTRSGNDGSVSINYSGSNSIIWAYGASSKKLADHGKNRYVIRRACMSPFCA